MLSLRRHHKHLAKRRHTALAAVAALAVPFVLVNLAASPAEAVSGSLFDAVNGRLDPTTPGRTEDWNNAATTVPSGLKYGIDTPTGKNDNSFAGGVDENTVNPAVRKGAIPNSKDDLNRFYMAYEQLGSGATAKQLLYLAWIRNKTSGSADMDFELNQSQQVAANGLPVRTPGDILVTYEFIATKSPEMSLLRWRTSSNRCWSGTADVAGTNCWAERTVLNSSNSEGAVNDGFTVVDKTRVAATRDLTLASQTFGEAAIDLTALGVFSPSTCTKFAQAFAKTRSSHSFSSSLQDLILPIAINLSNCLTKTFDITAPSNVPAGTTLNAVFTNNGTTHVVPLTGSGTTLSGSDSTIPPNTTLTNLHLELRNAANAVLWRTPDQSESMGTANKTNTGTFSYALTLSPASAENFVNRPHPLTATLTGTGALNNASSFTGPISGVSVGFLLENRVPTGCGSLSPTSAVTNAAGQATTTLTSTTACSTTIRAFVDKAGSTAGYNGGDVTSTATKTFVSYDLDVSPANATNLMGANHTFTLTLTRNTGSGAVGYANQTVAFSLTNTEATGAHLVSINGATASGTSGSCLTSSNGTCTVVATATKTGTFALNASYSTTNDSGTANIPATGEKTYVDYRLNLTPASATNEVGVAHTFVALLEKSVNDVWSPASGERLTFTFSPGASNATITGITPAGADPQPSCTTSAAGTCSVTINATSAGLATLTATFGATLHSGAFTRTASATKQYSDFALTATPLTAINDLGDPHTFTVTLTRNDGSGFTPYADQPVSLSLDQGGSDAHFTSINGTQASGTTGSCTTQANGTCAVTIVATTPGTVTLTANWSEALSTTSTATRTTTAEKRYISLTVGKGACALSIPLNGLTTFTIGWTLAGSTLTNARITDLLPAGVTYVSSTPTATTAPQVGQTGTVVWDLGTLQPGTGQVTVTVRGAQVGSWVNSGTLTADGGVSKAFEAGAVTVGNETASASGRAYGLSAALGGEYLIEPTPDVTNGNNHADNTVVLPTVPMLLGGSVGLMTVDNTPSVGANRATDSADATVASVNLSVAGVPVTARVVSARAYSEASGTSAYSTVNGSAVLDLKVGTGPALDYTNPTTVAVVNALGTKVAEIAVLEQVDRFGAALGGAAGAQPESGLFQSGLGVNGLHIRVLDGTADVIVAHATSKAAFPTADPCGDAPPFVTGSSFVASKTTTYETGPATVVVDPVILPSTGGNESQAASLADLSAIGATAGTGTASSAGQISPLGVDSDAAVERLKIGTALTATTITAHKEAGVGYVGESPDENTNVVIAKLVLAGTDLCVALGLTSTCTPDANRVLLLDPIDTIVMLNEQVGDTVNAVHIWILGRNNPLGLPLGSEIIISSATASVVQ